jgi:hypothetical protein
LLPKTPARELSRPRPPEEGSHPSTLRPPPRGTGNAMSEAAGWYHCRMSVIGRSAGRSAVAAAAYRLGDRLREEETERTHDYTRRHGVLTGFTVAPEGAPDWAYDPEQLWNQAHAADRRSNSQLAREWELALPASLSAEAREDIARRFAQELVDRYGVAATVAIHEPSRDGDERNHHAHIMMTTRRIGEDGFGEKAREFVGKASGPREVTRMRAFAADLINESLEEAGLEERVDHRSYEARGVDQEPTEHLGPGATAKERRGEKSERGDINRGIDERNRQLDELVGELAEIDREIAQAEEERLNGRFGEPEPDAEATDLAEFPEPLHDDPMDEYAGNVREAQRPGDSAMPWTREELEPPGEEPQEATGGEATGDPMDNYTAPMERSLHSQGEIGMRDGMTVFERFLHAVHEKRGQAVSWAQERWQAVKDRWSSWLDYVRNRDDYPPQEPDRDDDLGR